MVPAGALFGTDGIRGRANAEPLTPETAVCLGRAAVQLLGARTTRGRIVLGRDTRLSGDMLLSALAAGICSAGADALLVGVLPTPAIAYLTRTLRADAGVVISASHNSFADNGIKFFGAGGFKLSDAAEAEIEATVRCGAAAAPRPTAADVGAMSPVPDAEQRYQALLRGILPPGRGLAGLKVVIDCAHGAAYRVGPALLEQLGARVTGIGISPNGTNINEGQGAMHPQPLQEAVRAAQADFGLALDGDADRAIFVDAAGAVVDGDEILAMMAVEMLAQGTLRKGTVVATVMSNLGLELALRAHGARLVRTPVGDRAVVEEMQRHGYNLGGEQSGHLVFLDHSTTGDGLVAGLKVASLLLERQRPLSELKRVMTKFPQLLVNVPVERRVDLEGVTALQQTLQPIRASLNDRGRVLVRYSGTEPLVRVMVEAEDEARMRAYAEEIAAVIRQELGGTER